MNFESCMMSNFCYFSVGVGVTLNKIQARNYLAFGGFELQLSTQAVQYDYL